MRIGYLECFAGISGDMALGALVDAGVSPELLHETVRSLDVGAELEFVPVDRSGIRALKARVIVEGREADAPALAEHTHRHPHVESEHGHPHEHAHAHLHEHEHPHEHEHSHVDGRTLTVIREILRRSRMSAAAREMALRAFELLGQTEAKIHGVAIDEVHFHEVGAVDAIVDIACAAAGFMSLERERWYCSAVNVGGGFVDCAHGRFPVPAPATAELLKGVPTYSAGVKAELVTPTGATLLRALGCTFEPGVPMRFDAIGYGAGTRNPEKFPNVLRLSLGEEGVGQTQHETDTVTILECALDDLSPQVVAFAAQQALDHGALDVMCTSVVMKKGRAGTLLTVLCAESEAARLRELLFRETSTLGIRVRREERVVLARRFAEVQTEYGPVRIKCGMYGGKQVNAAPEYEDCRALALAAGVPVKNVMQAALAAAQGVSGSESETNFVTSAEKARAAR